MRKEGIKSVLQRAVSSLSLCSTMKTALLALLLCICVTTADISADMKKLTDSLADLQQDLINKGRDEIEGM